MNNYRYIPIRGKGINTYAFDITIEYRHGTWTASCPALLSRGASVSAKTQRQALLKIHHRVWMIVGAMSERGEMVPGYSTTVVTNVEGWYLGSGLTEGGRNHATDG